MEVLLISGSDIGETSKENCANQPQGIIMKKTKYLLAVLVSVVFAGISSADINYNESINGDLSNDTAAPTDLGIVDLGKNVISGLLENSVNFDPDVFSFTVEAGLQLDDVSFTSMTDSQAEHFLAFNDGLVSMSPGDNLITTLLDSSHVGLNFLDDTLPNTYGGSGVGGGPLSAGTYHIWFQETDGVDYDYTISISTSAAIPEPGSAMIVMFMGVCALASRRRK